MKVGEKTKCPKCGAEMNWRAEKLDLTAAVSNPEAIDEELGGRVPHLSEVLFYRSTHRPRELTSWPTATYPDSNDRKR